ncbi:FKBP-type peptidyl-prolyl cis-trans isomerase [Streptomyces sp. AA0539]|uniref:FKBP-type peptidyl-prolyl cis-trans isomerase n=1 Tax=Streptomyces sp. AA0539 TaxID=1210045 RepID=UPI0002EA2882|nr:FKBP-type peptidyl-prolyl cis-trans isomerase [Streptomyces sp. AA0539]
MIPTKRARRVVAALAVPAILLTAAACGSDDGSSSSGPLAAVSGKPGEQPTIELDEDAAAGKTSVEVLTEGDGAEVKQGDMLGMDVIGKTTGEQSDLVNTWMTQDGQPTTSDETPRPQLVTQAGVESALPEAITEPLIGTQVGSRVKVEGTAGELLGETADAVGLDKDQGMVWVFDINVAIDPTSSATGEQAPVEEGMPEVVAEGQEPATITIPDGDAPAELREQTLIEGDGAEVLAGHTLFVQYTGVNWEDGEKFDSSWDRDGGASFQIGAGQVISGWDETLVGKHVGDRVLMVLPPDKAYGEAGNASIPGNSTLVFVVDIIGVA